MLSPVIKFTLWLLQLLEKLLNTSSQARDTMPIAPVLGEIPADIDQITLPYGCWQVPKPFPGLGIAGQGARCLPGATLSSFWSQQY